MHINDRHASANRLFADHVAASFPNECEDLEIAGVDLEELERIAIGFTEENQHKGSKGQGVKATAKG